MFSGLAPEQWAFLLSQNRSWFDIQAKGGRAAVYLYDEIGFWGVTAKEFVRELNRLDVADIDLFINSPGGDVFDGYAIYNALKRHKATVTSTVDGLAASAASYIALAGEKVIMLKPSSMMIHNPWGVTIGDAPLHRKMADDLDKISDDIANIYADKSGDPVEEWRGRMDEENWYSADEAVAVGLADEVAEAAPANNLTTGRIFNLSKYRNVPEWVPHADEDKPVPAPARIAASARHMAVPAYLEHHDEAGHADQVRVARALDRAKNLAISVANREHVIRHLQGHTGRTV